MSCGIWGQCPYFDKAVTEHSRMKWLVSWAQYFSGTHLEASLISDCLLRKVGPTTFVTVGCCTNKLGHSCTFILKSAFFGVVLQFCSRIGLYTFQFDTFSLHYSIFVARFVPSFLVSLYLQSCQADCFLKISLYRDGVMS
jgi:hypothetical protein